MQRKTVENQGNTSTFSRKNPRSSKIGHKVTGQVQFGSRIFLNAINQHFLELTYPAHIRVSIDSLTVHRANILPQVLSKTRFSPACKSKTKTIFPEVQVIAYQQKMSSLGRTAKLTMAELHDLMDKIENTQCSQEKSLVQRKGKIYYKWR